MNVINLRPSNFNDFIGKDNVKLVLKIAIENSLKLSTNLDHIIFYGNPGIGKTSLATIIANEMNRKIHYIQGGTIKQYSDLLDIVSIINEHDILFIDEIHNIDDKIFELFHSLLEDFVIDIKIGKELNSQYNRFSVPRFTLIGSTTKLSNIPQPLVDRFPIKLWIDNYTDDEISLILNKINSFIDVGINEEEINIIAKCAKGIPRIGINILRRVIDFKCFDKDNFNIVDCLLNIGIFPLGLEIIDFKYLLILYESNSNVGLNQLSQCLYVDKKMIEEKIEPYLLRTKLIIRLRNGRQLTEIGREYVSNNLKYFKHS